jgi:hypothetical protein
MAGLKRQARFPAIHVLVSNKSEHVDARHKRA